jgi:hypothetical protein
MNTAQHCCCRGGVPFMLRKSQGRHPKNPQIFAPDTKAPRSHSSSFDHRVRPETFFAAIATARSTQKPGSLLWNVAVHLVCAMRFTDTFLSRNSRRKPILGQRGRPLRTWGGSRHRLACLSRSQNYAIVQTGPRALRRFVPENFVDRALRKVDIVPMSTRYCLG